MHKNKILILEGGFNEEHEVSLATAKEIKKSLYNQKLATFEEDNLYDQKDAEGFIKLKALRFRN